MEIFNTILKVREYLDNYRRACKSIGFVPTMGYLHDGHLSLIKAARRDCDVVVASIFVNPTQFAPNEDLESYPRDLDKDKKLLESEGCAAVFFPDTEEMYGKDFETYVSLEKLPNHLCGLSRPEHFKGVATVVTKLFNIIQPDNAYFGQKDFQQFQVIQRMVNDLNIPVRVVICPIVREEDGLAMSSRNMYLDKEQRSDAIKLHEALLMGRDLIKEGKIEIGDIINKMKEYIKQSPYAKIDYIQISDIETLDEISSLTEIKNGCVLAGAVWFGKARLIDNEILK